MFNEREFDRLQKLACINLNPQDKKKLGNQIVSIIDFLDKLKNIEIDVSISQLNRTEINNSLRLVSGTKERNCINGLLENVKHNKINNNVVIKSVLL